MLTIGEFSKISRVSAKTLRYYDLIGLLKPEYVSRDTGYRYYEISQLRTMLLIARLKQYGFSLPEIAAYLSSQSDAYLLDVMQRKKSELKSQLLDQQRIINLMDQDIKKIERCEYIMQSEYLVKTTEFKPLKVFSVRKKMSLKDFGVAYSELFAAMENNNVEPSGPCISVYHDEDFNPENSDIEVGIVADNEKSRNLAPGLCCYVTRIGPYDDFSPCYTALAEWIEREGYRISGPAIELYVKGCSDGISPDEYVTEIYCPISKID